MLLDVFLCFLLYISRKIILGNKMKVNILLKIIEKERNARIDKSNKSSVFIFQAYSNIISRIKESFGDSEVITPKKIYNLNISDGMKEKLKRMIENPKKPIKTQKTSLKKIDKKSSKFLIDELVKYLGLGLKKANDLIKDGLTSISQLKQKKYFDKLPLETRTIIKTNPLRKIPHENIKSIEKLITSVDGYQAMIVGSYRRGSAFSRDIDVMIISNDPNSLDNYLEYLKKKFIIVVYRKGFDKMSLVLKGSKTNGYYKLDAFLTSEKDAPAMLLYSTGPKMFNIRMRSIAKASGYLLNQEGLYNRKTSKKIETSSERDFFDKLNMAYIVPEKR